MNLLIFIELNKERMFKLTSYSSRDHYKQFIESLTAFPGGQEAYLKQAQTHDFILKYGRFLTEDYTKKYSPTVANQYVERLRTVIRYAIRNYAIPNHDPIPAALKQLRSDYWKLDAKAEEPKAIDINLAEPLTKLSRNLSWVFSNRNKTKVEDPKQQRKQKEEYADAKAAAIYLFGMLTYGLDIENIIRLQKPNADGKIYIPKYGKSLPLPASALSLARLYNEGRINAGANGLFKVVLDTDTEEQIAHKAKAIKQKACRHLKRIGLDSSLMAYSNPQDEWLTLVSENGADPDSFEKVLLASIKGEYEKVDEKDWLDLNLCKGASDRYLEQKWYALCSYSSQLRGSHMREIIAKSELLGNRNDALKRLYDPFDYTQGSSERSNIINRFLFFKATPFEALLIDKLQTNASVLRDSGTKCFATVPQKEIEYLQVALRDFREDIELIDRDEWMRLHQSELAINAKVKIHEGLFRGYTATIIDIKGSNTKEPYYILELPHQLYTIKATKQALSLNLVKE